VSGATASCAPYACGTGACKSAPCAAGTDCAAGVACDPDSSTCH
jgi:hypothetical protein